MIDRETFETVQARLIARTQVFHLKLQHLERELGENQEGVSTHYMALAWEMIGVEAEFVIPDTHHSAKTLNRDLLQLYVNFVLMKATYYSLGVRCRARVGLTEQEVRNVKDYFGAVVHGANQHVNKTFKDLRSYTDDEKYAETMYLRNQMRDHGYIAIWQNMLVNEGRRLALDELRFSTNFGRYDSADDADRMVNKATRVLTPPRTVGSQYGRLRLLTVYHRSGGEYYDRQPVGFRMVFEPADETRFVGYASGANNTFELGQTFRLTKVVGYSWGGGRVHGLKLTFTDDEANARTYKFGCESAKNERQRLFLFEKPGYYIAALYAGLDEKTDFKGLRTMSVSYLPLKSEAAGDANDDGMVDWRCDDSEPKAQLRQRLETRRWQTESAVAPATAKRHNQRISNH